MDAACNGGRMHGTNTFCRDATWQGKHAAAARPRPMSMDVEGVMRVRRRAEIVAILARSRPTTAVVTRRSLRQASGYVNEGRDAGNAQEPQ